MPWPPDPLAAYGAALATVTFGWNAWRALRDRGRLRLSLYIGEIIEVASGCRGSEHVAGAIVNVGSRPIHVRAVEVELVDGRRRMVTPGTQPNLVYQMPSFPCELREGAQAQFRFPLDLLSETAAGVCVTDTTGRTWRVPRKVFRAVHESALRHLAERGASKRAD